MSFIDSLDGFFSDVADITGSGVRRFTDLETVDVGYDQDGQEIKDDQNFVLRDGSLMTMIKIDGHRKIVGHEEFNQAVMMMDERMRGRMKTPGASMAWYFRYDPADKSSAEKAINSMRNTAKTLQMDLDDLIDDWEKAVKRYIRGESIYLTVTTRLGALQRQDRSDSGKEMGKANADSPLKGRAGSFQRVENIAIKLRDKHIAEVKSIVDTLNEASVNVSCSVMKVRDALLAMRMIIAPEQTGRDWTAALPGDPIPNRLKDTTDGWIMDSPYYPALHAQLFNDDRELVNAKTVRWGNKFRRSIFVETPPNDGAEFNDLFRSLTKPGYSWSMAIHLDSQGVGHFGFKNALATILLPTSSVNRRLHRAVNEVKRLEEGSGLAGVRVRITFSVEADTIEALERGTSDVITAVQSWKSATVSVPLGSLQELGVATTVPGLISKSPSNASLMMLGDVLAMLPWTRPAKVWESGMPYRTNDGRMFPWEQGSGKQTSWVEIGIGPMGAGKSVTLNANNLAFLLSPGLVRMPWLSISDIGPSSLGLIRTIQDSLPEDKKYLATYVRLKMEPERYAVNVLDTAPGLTKPLAMHKSFLVNFISMLATPTGAKMPESMDQIARTSIDMAYDRCKNNNNPKLYSKNADPGAPDALHIDSMIEKLNIEYDEHTSWYDLVEEFFDRDMHREAEICNRYAVPTLHEVFNMGKDATLIQDYGDDLCNRFWRNGMDAIAAYPILAKPTRFSLGEARVVSLDLDEVAQKGGGAAADKQTSAMFMLSRHLLLSRFFVQDDDVYQFEEKYREYQAKRISDLRQDMKRIVFDELHRSTKNEAVKEQIMGDINTAERESRKWNLHIALYSQSPEDFPTDTMERATNVFIMGVAQSAQMAHRIDKLMNFGDTATDMMVKYLRKPSSAGSTIIAKFNTEDGVVTSFLMNTLGSTLLWALSSTTEDSRLRNKLYDTLGGKLTRKALATLFPGGTIKDEFERMKAAHSENRFICDDDRIIYERLSGQQSEKPDALDVLRERVLLQIRREQEAKRPSIIED